MSLAELGLRTTNFTQNQSSVEWYTASSRRARFHEISIIQVTGTAQTLGLGRPQAQGVTPVPVLFQRQDPGDVACVTSGSLSWGTSPTVPSIYMRRWNSAGTVGVGVCWTFPRGIQLAISASLVIQNISNPAVAADINALIDE